MAYIRQNGKPSSCGPIAIYNALVWLGCKPNIRSLIMQTKCKRTYGTYIKNITACLRKNKVKFTYKRKIKASEVIKALNKKYTIIYLFHVPHKHAHYVFIIGIKKEGKQVILSVVNNYGTKKLISDIPLKIFNKYSSFANILRTHNKWYYSYYPQAWIIKSLKK